MRNWRKDAVSSATLRSATTEPTSSSAGLEGHLDGHVALAAQVERGRSGPLPPLASCSCDNAARNGSSMLPSEDTERRGGWPGA